MRIRAFRGGRWLPEPVVRLPERVFRLRELAFDYVDWLFGYANGCGGLVGAELDAELGWGSGDGAQGGEDARLAVEHLAYQAEPVQWARLLEELLPVVNGEQAVGGQQVSQ